MRTRCATALLIASVGVALAAPADRDERMDRYLAIWARDEAVTPATVARLYARDVVYYGRSMSAAAVYRDKLAFVRRWPRRAYAVVPGSVTNDCRAASETCRVRALIRWRRSGAAGRGTEAGVNTIALTLVREEGTLKIARESGAPARAVGR